jgi:uncharacterized protein YyaL (SSP411 family)
MTHRAAANRLAAETSPYLRQHAGNPVDWYPWADEALTRAQREGKPILLSIGYSACHWCHVMERESFEDEDTAALMNAHFVCIKVDREERPDLDALYMGAVQALTGSGGWPLTVFLTPAREPFYGGTYFPPVDRHGMPGFPRLLRAIASHWRDKPEAVASAASQIMAAVAQQARPLPPVAGDPQWAWLDEAAARLSRAHDAVHGGFGGAPKFPGAAAVGLLLRQHYRTGADEARQMAAHTLTQMALGGIHDHVGGGFHRYAVDAQWRVPHFEKMLYDNALLATAYLEGFQATGQPLFAQVASTTLDYICRDLAAPGGGFAAAEDADSAGGEGCFYTWLASDLTAALGAAAGAICAERFGVAAAGHLEDGRSVLHLQHDLTGDEQRRWAEYRPVLAAWRDQRPRPARDDKVIVAWNGLAISALARGAGVLAEPRYLVAAERAAEFVLTHLRPDGGLGHSWKDGVAQPSAFQDDYAALAQSLLDLFEATGASRWLDLAVDLAGAMLARFWDAEAGGFFLTEAGATDLVLRVRVTQDGATPSGPAIALALLVRLGHHTGAAPWADRAAQLVASLSGLMTRFPEACPALLCGLDWLLSGPVEVVVTGTGAAREALLGAAWRPFLPHRVLVLADGETGGPAARHPLLDGRLQIAAGGARAYVCRHHTCSPPVTDAAVLGHLLAGAR